MLQPILLCNLLVEPGAHPRGQAHLSAASGLVRVDGRLYLVADDEHHLGTLAADGAGVVQLHRLLAGDLPADKGKRKKQKPDLEALALLPAEPGMAHGALLALGSGSRPNRQQALQVVLDGGGLPCAAPVTYDLAAMYQPLREQFPDLNIEGAFVAGQRLRLLQRGNKGDARNACIDYPLAQLRAWMAGGADAPIPQNIQEFSLGDAGGVPLGFTDGAALPGGGWLFSAVAEDTGDSYNDGACGASAIGWVTEGGTLQRLEYVAGAPKIEGITLAEDGRLLMVTDSDDPATPSALLSLAV
ncbi:hypothetical protein [Ramlibacter sp. WS9]|uniref:DUF6929 family protein n=1 Tax=Ramlibacter sp. WS9 TaxID=1882741 RepID=UPI001143756D|nr:hypothetical protein [Ramlibacter sp. WS9]ROZ61812.1 hypothetical protein EEB15_32045 [Ramlibacter sp. WS9]